MTVTVCLPVFNEEANLPTLLETLLGDDEVGEIAAVDDCSTDSSPHILANYAAHDDRLTVLRNPERSGQLAGWLLAARAARFERLLFIDADARPARGAIALLAHALSGNVAIASGRVVAAGSSARLPAARFRAAMIHRARSMGYAKEAIIGRFFAAERDWFVQAIQRTDVIANDVYLSCLACREGRASVYVPRAVCYYTETSTLRDFAAQRQRADAGYAQLRSMGLLKAGDEPGSLEYLQCLLVEATRDPVGAAAWIRNQVSSRFLRTYEVRGRDAGAWETQPSTKQRVDL
jgi:glycosyltransferase involved in cell wall biosynthesis